MAKVKPIGYRMQRELECKVKLCTSKRTERGKTADDRSPYIHSRATAATYMQQARQYGTWLRERGLNKCSMDEAREHAAEYVTSLGSAWTQYTARSALAKVFGCASSEICDLPPRRAGSIRRGRTLTARAAAIERNHPELTEICRSVGLRKDRELSGVTAANFHVGEDGHLYCHVQGKGGRWRDAMVLDGPGRELIEAAIRAHPEGPMFHVPSHMNVHALRADYAARCYEYAMSHGMADGRAYRCRDGSGRVYDKGALDWVSAQLGHGRERYHTVVYHYLSYGEIELSMSKSS